LTEADRSVREANALVELQRLHVEQLEQAGEDTTSAKIAFESLLISLACCVEHRHRLHTVFNANGKHSRAA
jgi:hypothetical protein